MVVTEVEVDLYSGRPNPRFALDAASGAELERRLAALPPLTGGTSPRDGLGYRGLRVTGGGVTFVEVRVSAGVAEVRDGRGAVHRRADPGRGLERWLVELAARRLAPGEVDFLRGDLDR
jgi:hypothetical protein